MAGLAALAPGWTGAAGCSRRHQRKCAGLFLTAGQPVNVLAILDGHRATRSATRAGGFLSSTTHRHRCRRGITTATAANAAAEGDATPSTDHHGTPVLLLMLSTIVCAVANRVLSKQVMVFMSGNALVLTAVACLAYVIVFGAVLIARTRSGVVPVEMLESAPRGQLAAIGFLEAASQSMGYVLAGILPGVLIPVLSQTCTLWTVSLSALLLGRRYQLGQILGIASVVAGVVLVLVPSGGVQLTPAVTRAAAALVALMAVPAFCSILKEAMFTRGRKMHGPGGYDVFVVNTFGSIAQFTSILLLLPLTQLVQGKDVVAMLAAGGAALSKAPILLTIYLTINVLFNILALTVMKQTNALTLMLLMACAVPLSALAFTLPIPFLGEPATLGATYFLGLGCVFAGLVSYAWFGRPVPQARKFEILFRGSD